MRGETTQQRLRGGAMWFSNRMAIGIIMIASCIAAFTLLVLYTNDGLPIAAQATIESATVSRIEMELGTPRDLKEYGSSYEILAIRLGDTEGLAIWAMKGKDRMIIGKEKWLKLDKIEVRLESYNPDEQTLFVEIRKPGN